MTKITLDLENRVYWELRLQASRKGQTIQEVIEGALEATRTDIPTGPPWAKPVVHVVQPGDTMARLAAAYLGDGRLWPWIASSNPHIENPAVLYEGDELVLPEAAPKRWYPPVELWQNTWYYQFGHRYSSGPYRGLPHPGVDLPGVLGAPVWAIGDGQVVENTMSSSGYGHYVVIQHECWGLTAGPCWSLYAHLREEYEGPPIGTVIRGPRTQVGQMGQTGAGANNITHLHFEVRKRRWTPWTQLSDQTLHAWWWSPHTFVDAASSLCVPQ